MDKLRIMSVFGTRPEAIKMCPLVKELASRPGIESLCCVTAQHRQMLDSVLEVFGVAPDRDLDIMAPRQTLSHITSKCLLGMDEAIDELKPDMILVHGDTSTTLPGLSPRIIIRFPWAMWRRACGPMTNTPPFPRR